MKNITPWRHRGRETIRERLWLTRTALCGTQASCLAAEIRPLGYDPSREPAADTEMAC